MLAIINFVILLESTFLTLVFYNKSAGPVALEQKTGPSAWKKCTTYRFISGLFMGIAAVNYVIYYFYPLNIPLPETFPWNWYVSAIIAVIIAIPSGYILIKGMKDAGEETMITKKEHIMYGGIYKKIRHPQAVGELPFWWVMAFLLHSPFLCLYSILWIPVFILMCIAEEKDLLLRYGRPYEEYRSRTGMIWPGK